MTHRVAHIEGTLCATELAMTPLRLADERLLVWVHTVAPVALTGPQPEPLGRIQFGGIRRQEERRYSPWPVELLRSVPARSVQDHHSVLAWAEFLAAALRKCCMVLVFASLCGATIDHPVTGSTIPKAQIDFRPVWRTTVGRDPAGGAWAVA